MVYTVVLDTLPTDSVNALDNAGQIEELGALLPGGKQQVVKRRKRVPKTQVAKRYAQTIFETANPSIYGTASSGVNGDYPLQVGDQLVLTIWGEVEKEYALRVNNQGRVTVEGIGMVSVNNATLASAEAAIKQKLSKIYSGIKTGRTQVNLRPEKLSAVKVFILGDVAKPGGYVFYGNTSIFQALYQAGGPTDIGSVRSIQVTRPGKSFTLDLYQYLMHGKKAEPSVLHDGDIVFLPRASVLAEAKGDVGRAAIYELKPGEGVKELLEYAGRPNATAANQNLVVERLFEDGRRDALTIGAPGDYLQGKEKFPLQDGDALQVYRSTEPSKASVTILGAVKYPGTYQWSAGMAAPDLVNTAGGVNNTGFGGRIHVLRALPQGGFNLFSQNLGSGEAVKLAALDTVVVYSAKDMFRPDSVTVGGAVAKPGTYLFYQGMGAKDLVLLAGGFLPNRKKGQLRLERVHENARGTRSAVLDVSDSYDAGEAVPLQPWDHLEVPIDAEFYRPEAVALTGAFKNPGVYTLAHPGETLKSLIDRAGGFLADGYPEGAQFFRKDLKKNYIELAARDTVAANVATIATLTVPWGLVGIDVAKAAKGDKKNNVELQNGDSVHVPQKAISVRVTGEVGLPTNVLWCKGCDAQYYVNQAGGVAVNGDDARVMIRYANGSMALASDADRDPDPGAEVIVPYKKALEPIRWTQVVSALGSVISAFAMILVATIQFN
jgi:protein involved in polysaccharide export with SLBB domain